MIVTRPLHPNEPDLLLGFETTPLLVECLDGKIQKEYSPKHKVVWTHDELESIDLDSVFPEGWNASLGGQFVGSSEV